MVGEKKKKIILLKKWGIWNFYLPKKGLWENLEGIIHSFNGEKSTHRHTPENRVMHINKHTAHIINYSYGFSSSGLGACPPFWTPSITGPLGSGQAFVDVETRMTRAARSIGQAATREISWPLIGPPD